jgi:hypothetical protein
VEGAVISHLVNQQPGGATLAELSVALKYERDTIQAAVDSLVRLEILTVIGGRIVVGPPSTCE